MEVPAEMPTPALVPEFRDIRILSKTLPLKADAGNNEYCSGELI